MTPRRLVDQLQGRFDAELVPIPPNDVERADATLLAAARLFYGSVVERLALMPQRPDYWSAGEPGAEQHARLRRYEVMGRTVLAELGSVEAPELVHECVKDASPDCDCDECKAPPLAWGGDAPAPGTLVRHELGGRTFRVIRSRTFPRAERTLPAGELKCLCERLSGEHAGEQAWIAAAELTPHAASEHA